MGKIVSKASRKFTKALFAVLTVEDYQSVNESLGALSQVWGSDEQVNSFFANPSVKLDDKKSLVKDLAAAINNQKLVNALLLLVDNSQLNLLLSLIHI